VRRHAEAGSSTFIEIAVAAARVWRTGLGSRSAHQKGYYLPSHGRNRAPPPRFLPHHIRVCGLQGLPPKLNSRHRGFLARALEEGPIPRAMAWCAGGRAISSCNCMRSSDVSNGRRRLQTYAWPGPGIGPEPCRA
jgi:hypothetical protein